MSENPLSGMGIGFYPVDPEFTEHNGSIIRADQADEVFFLQPKQVAHIIVNGTSLKPEEVYDEAIGMKTGEDMIPEHWQDGGLISLISAIQKLEDWQQALLPAEIMEMIEQKWLPYLQEQYPDSFPETQAHQTPQEETEAAHSGDAFTDFITKTLDMDDLDQGTKR